MSTVKKSVKKHDSITNLIAHCAKNNVKTLKQDQNGVFVEFFPRSPDQLQQPFYEKLVIDNKVPPVPKHLEEQYNKLMEEDQEDMLILEDPSTYEQNLVKEMLGEHNEE